MNKAILAGVAIFALLGAILSIPMIQHADAADSKTVKKETTKKDTKKKPTASTGKATSTAKVEIAKGSGSDEKCEKANTCFVPSEVKITKGGTVTWVNKDSGSHTVLSGNIKTGPDNKFGTTDVLPKDGSFSQKFDKAGTYEYFDIVHPWMKGKVIVS
mgnify:CR=1 FL=1